jgi:hypothetical protein
MITDAQKWNQARVHEMIAVDNLKRLNPTSGQISHSQAECVLVGFFEKSGFTQLATLFKNLKEERGWTYTEVK